MGSRVVMQGLENMAVEEPFLLHKQQEWSLDCATLQAGSARDDGISCHMRIPWIVPGQAGCSGSITPPLGSTPCLEARSFPRLVVSRILRRKAPCFVCQDGIGARDALGTGKAEGSAMPVGSWV